MTEPWRTKIEIQIELQIMILSNCKYYETYSRQIVLRNILTTTSHANIEKTFVGLDQT